jgi:hypothetical protein
VLPAKTFIGRQITAPGSGRSRSHWPAFEVNAGAAGKLMIPLLYSSAIATIATTINDRRRGMRISMARTAIAARAAIANSASTLNRADARIAAMPNSVL